MSSPHPFVSSPSMQQNQLSDRENDLAKKTPANSIQTLFAFIAAQTSLEDILEQLPGRLADLFNAKDCLVTLSSAIKERASQSENSAVAEKFTNLGRQDYPRDRDLILQHIMASGKSLLIEGIEKSPCTEKAEQLGGGPPKSMILSPILVNGWVFGVVHVNGPRHKRCFDQEDLGLLDIIMLFLAKSIQLMQLQALAESKFIQLALARSMEKTMDHIRMDPIPHLDKMARIVAKSFYREMTKAGFCSHQIMNAAAEIISELNNSLCKYGKRLNHSVTKDIQP